MISIIISSAGAEQLLQVTENISLTIGVPFEIISRDNTVDPKGICEVYNSCAAQAKYPILCFMHQDIIVKTNNWGQVLADIFNNNAEIGLVGVAGSSYKSLSPSPWGGHAIDTKYLNLEQCYKFKDSAPRHLYRNPKDEKITEVAVIDGVFICTTKKVFAEHPFDNQLFKGFHAYDVDLSLSIGQKYKVVVTYDIFLSHLSEGRYDKVWMEQNIILHNKWNAHLPVNIEGLTLKQQELVEKVSFRSFINELVEFDIPLAAASELLWKNNRFVNLFLKIFWKMNFYLLKMKAKESR